ncbi:tetratricopeptide repeat protein [Calothrix membranacea FACHB-236]|nr:tetratricopeptide repeat protein [Calothrix membranacea FACHB-236]
MTSTIQISPEVYQTVLADKINEAILQATYLFNTKIYDQALKTYHQILNYIALLNNGEQRSYWISYLLGYADIVYILQPLAKLTPQEQDKWIEWLKKVQQSVLNFHEDSRVITQDLKQLAKVYQNLGRSELMAIAMQKATTAALQIPDPTTRTEQLIQLVSVWLEYQQKAKVHELLTQALTSVEQISAEEPFSRSNSLSSIAMLYLQMGEPKRAIALAEKVAKEYSPESILIEVVRDAIKREDLHLAQAIIPKIQTVEFQAFCLAEIAVYWATHNQPRLGNRLFAKALKQVAKQEAAESHQANVIQIYSTSGQLTILLNAIQRLTHEGLKTSVLAALAIVYAKAKQPQQLQQVLAEIQRLNDGEAILLSTAINSQEYNLAIALFKKLKNPSNFVYQSGLYQQLIQALLQLQNLDQALEVAKQANRDLWPEERNLMLKEIAIAYADNQQWSQAIAVAKQVKNTLLKPYQVLTSAELAAKAPTIAEFTSLIQPAIAQAKTLTEIEHQALSLAVIAQAYVHTGETEQTQSFLQQAIKILQQVQDDENRSRLFAQVVEYLINQKQYIAALKIAEAYSTSPLLEYVYNAIYYEINIHNNIDVALQVVEVESLPDRQATTLLAIARIYALQQRRQDALAYLDRAFVVAQQIADPESRTINRYENSPEPDYNDRRSQYTRLVKQYVALEQPDKAQQVVAKVQETSLRDYLQAWID